MAALRAAAPLFSKSSVVAVSRCCTAARRATREAGVVGNHPAIHWRSVSSSTDKDVHSTGFSANGDEPGSMGIFSSTFANALPGAGSGGKKQDDTGGSSGPSTNVNLQKALEMVKQLDLSDSEREIFLKEVDMKFSLYKDPAEVAKGIRTMNLSTMAEMTWLLEALHVKCGPWIYVVDHLLEKRGIKEQPDFTMAEYEKSPGECRTELKTHEIVRSQDLTTKTLVDMSKLMSDMDIKPPVPMFSITIGGRTIDFGGLLWKIINAVRGDGTSRFR